jgi:hypothetical protein
MEVRSFRSAASLMAAIALGADSLLSDLGSGEKQPPNNPVAKTMIPIFQFIPIRHAAGKYCRGIKGF